MIDLKHCIVCKGEDLDDYLPATFFGTMEDAAPYFLTHRIKAVRGNIRQCSNCNFIFTSPQFEPSDYRKIYQSIPEAKTEQAESDHRFNEIKNTIGNYNKNGKLIDLGCGNGRFMEIMQPQFECLGFEPQASTNIKQADNILEVDFLEWMSSQQPTVNNQYDIVTALDFLEHIPEIENYFTEINRVLKDEGIFYCTLPDVSSWAARLFQSKWNCFLLEHLWYFSPKTFNHFIERFGFTLVSAKPFPYSTTLGIILKRIRQTYQIPLPENIPSWISSLRFSLPIGLMFCVCKKTNTP